MKKSGFFWHHNHDSLCGYSPDIRKRMAAIEKYKPANEIPLRIRLLKSVRGKLPVKFVEAEKEFRETWDKYRPKIEALHKKECPNCPWDGKTIFPEKVV